MTVAVHLLVGTTKGAFILTSTDRDVWDQSDGPHCNGWTINHMATATPDSARFGPAAGATGTVPGSGDRRMAAQHGHSASCRLAKWMNGPPMIPTLRR